MRLDGGGVWVGAGGTDIQHLAKKNYQQPIIVWRIFDKPQFWSALHTVYTQLSAQANDLLSMPLNGFVDDKITSKGKLLCQTQAKRIDLVWYRGTIGLYNVV